MAEHQNTTRNTGGNVVRMPGLSVESELSEIESIVDAMIFMHESVQDGDRDRVMTAETALLWIIKEKCQSGQTHLLRMPGHYSRAWA